MMGENRKKGFWLDPRAKLFLILMCVLASMVAPSLGYQFILVLLIALLGVLFGKWKYAVNAVCFYAVICVLTVWIMTEMTGTLRTMFVAFLGLFHKVYACGMLAGIVLSTTKVSEFLSAMNRIHAPKKLVIPLAVMLRYIPTIQEDWRFIKDAMRMRDVSPTPAGFLKNPGMTIECIYVPLMMAASKAADELSIASITRGIENPSQPDKGVFIAESPKVIATALDAGYEPLSLLMERRHIEGDAQPILARCGEIPVYTAERETLARLTGFELTRGVLCAMRRPRLPSVEEVCARARRVAVLEGIVDHTNVGAIFRSAAALGIDAVLVTPTCCDPFYRRAVRVSMGTVFQVPWARIGEDAADWPQKGVERLHALGFRTAAMALTDNSVRIDDAQLAAEPRLAIVLGTEGDGLSPRTIAACDYTVKIPMAHGVDSLNVAAASAVAFWQLRTK